MRACYYYMGSIHLMIGKIVSSRKLCFLLHFKKGNNNFSSALDNGFEK